MVTALFPITYQKLNDDWDVHARGAEDDARLARHERLQHVGEVGCAVLEIGVEDRGELLGRVLERSAYGGALPLVPLVENDLDALGPGSRLEKLSGSVGRAVVDDDELAR